MAIATPQNNQASLDTLNSAKNELLAMSQSPKLQPASATPSTLGIGGGTKAPAGQEYGANGSLQPLQATPTTTGATTPPPQKTSQQIQAEADALHDQPLPSDTDTRASSKIGDNFQAMLDNIGAAPKAPDTNALQVQGEEQQGVAGIQTNLKALNDQYTAISNDIQNRQANEASKPGVVASIINGRMKMISAEDNKVLTDLKAQITSANTQLTQANTAVATFMRNKQTDYTNASALYEKEYTAALSAYKDDVSQQDKEQSAAKANAQVIINSYKGSSIGIDSIIPEQEAQWTTLEQQSGLPEGTIKAAVTAELNITKFTKGSDGNMYISGTDNNGIPYTAKVGTAGGTTTEANVKAGVQKNTATSGESTKGGTPLTKTQYARLSGVGISSEIANTITSEILSGTSLDTIRQNIRDAGGNPKILDQYDNAVSIKSILKNSPKASASVAPPNTAGNTP